MLAGETPGVAAQQGMRMHGLLTHKVESKSAAASHRTGNNAALQPVLLQERQLQTCHQLQLSAQAGLQAPP